ncbi:MAG TPA: FHA domain-containing protein [Candidatus Aminicenantes bacterium]|nr:FHA domain-containing protein [Candidatus Aminicenantes bacterium]
MQLNVYWIIALVLLIAALLGMGILIRRRKSLYDEIDSELDEESSAEEEVFPPAHDLFDSSVWGRVDIMVEGRRISTQRVHLTTATIGRDPGQAQIVIPELIVSKQHCELFEKSGSLWIRDAGSTNGLFRDGEQIQEAEVTHGAVFSLGRRGSVKLVFTTDPPQES